MSNPQTIHVRPYGRGWAVRFSDDGYPVAIATTQDEAVIRARELCTQQGCELVVFNDRGEITAQEPAADATAR